MAELLDLLKNGGPYGVIVILLWTILELDRRARQKEQAHLLAIQQYQAALQAEHEKRLEDQRQATRALLEQSGQAHVALERAAEVIEALNSTTQRRLLR